MSVKMSAEGFKLFLGHFFNLCSLRFTVERERIDYETFVALIAEHDPKIAPLVEAYLEAARKLRVYIDERHVDTPAQAPPVLSDKPGGLN